MIDLYYDQGGAAALPNLTRRAVILGGLAAVASACTQTVMTPDVAQGVRIRRVQVTATNLANYSVRDLPIPKERFADDLRGVVIRKLADRTSTNGNADLVISLTRVLLKSPGLSLIAGGPSLIDSVVEVRRVADGTPISGSIQFSGTAQETRLGGILGAIGAPSAQDDYRMTLDGYATMLHAALFEGGATQF